MTASETLKFGKYIGRTIENVWTGIVVDKNEREIIDDYLKELCEFFSGVNESFEIPIPDLTSEIYSSNCPEYEIATKNIGNYKLEINENKIIFDSNDEIRIDLMNFFIKLLSSDIYNPLEKPLTIKSKPNGRGYSPNTKKYLSLQADPSYINYCIREIPKFYINPSDIVELQKKYPRNLEKFKIEQLNDTTLTYSPLFKQSIFYLPIETVKLNEEKYLKYSSNITGDFETRDSYDKYGGYNGYSDNAIDSAFEGDPENTWNVD